MTVLTDKFLRGLKAGPVAFEERDAACPGLVIRVGLKGRKVWECIVTQNGKRRRVRIGTFPELSLAGARRKAGELKNDPTVTAAPLRLAELWEMYSAEREGQRRAFDDVESCWRQWVEPALGRVRLSDLSLRHGADLLAKISRESSANRARKVVVNLRPMLNFAVGRGLMASNPWRDLSLPEGVEARDRVLSEAEWVALWRWGERARHPWGAFLHVLMLSGQRLIDVAKMAWAEIDADLWAIPAARHKSERRHEVPLSEALAGILARLPRTGSHVFSTRPGTAIAPGSKIAAKMQLESGTTEWRLHDIRRTAATMMGDAGVERFTIERVLGHADNSVTGRYDRATYREAKRRALEVLAAATAAAARKAEKAERDAATVAEPATG